MFGLDGEFEIVGKHQAEGMDWKNLFAPKPQEQPEQVG